MPEIDGEKLKEYIQEELENVASLKKQLTDAQIDKLRMSDYTKEEIRETLLEMENYNGLAKKYRSVYLTLSNWIKLKRRITKRGDKGSGKPGGYGGTGWIATYDEALRFLQKHNLPLDVPQYFEKVEQGEGEKPKWRKK